MMIVYFSGHAIGLKSETPEEAQRLKKCEGKALLPCKCLLHPYDDAPLLHLHFVEPSDEEEMFMTPTREQTPTYRREGLTEDRPKITQTELDICLKALNVIRDWYKELEALDAGEDFYTLMRRLPEKMEGFDEIKDEIDLPTFDND